MKQQELELQSIIAEAWAQYNRAIAPARGEFNRVNAEATARAEFQRVVVEAVEAMAELNRIYAQARAECERIIAEAKAECERAIAEADAERKRTIAAARNKSVGDDDRGNGYFNPFNNPNDWRD